MDNNNFNLFVCKLFTFNKNEKENYMASVYYFIIIFFILEHYQLLCICFSWEDGETERQRKGR